MHLLENIVFHIVIVENNYKKLALSLKQALKIMLNLELMLMDFFSGEKKFAENHRKLFALLVLLHQLVGS